MAARCKVGSSIRTNTVSNAYLGALCRSAIAKDSKGHAGETCNRDSLDDWCRNCCEDQQNERDEEENRQRRRRS